MPFEAYKNATELGIDITRKFRRITLGISSNNNIVILSRDDGTDSPWFVEEGKTEEHCIPWYTLIYDNEPMPSECPPPPYILCSTPELAIKVLSKIEKGFPVREWMYIGRATNYIPKSCYPEMVINTTNHFLEYNDKKYYKNVYKIEYFTTAEEYLDIK